MKWVNTTKRDRKLFEFTITILSTKKYGGRAEKLGVQVPKTRLSNFQFGKETICYIHTDHFLSKFSKARIDFIKLTHLIGSLTTNRELCTVYLFTFRLHTNSLYAVYNRSVIWRPCATLGNCPSLNTQSCHRRPLCSTFTFEKFHSP